MGINDDFEEIMRYAHFWNWVPDWDVVQRVYRAFPESYSVLTPFAYTYLEELIRSTTSEYGQEITDDLGNPKRRKVGLRLIQLAIDENSQNNSEYVKHLEEIKHYFEMSSILDTGDNRNSVVHGYSHPRVWYDDSFEQLIHDIAKISKYAQF